MPVTLRVRQLFATAPILLALAIGGCADGGEGSVQSRKMATIRNRDKLVCGVDGTMPGFSIVGPSGRYTGLDVEICRAMAAALLGDGEKVEFHNLTASERFAAVASGEVDLLSRNTTWTLSRDAPGGNGLSYAPIVYFDGQGFLVPAASGLRRPEQLRGKPICVVSGTTTELNLSDWMRSRGIAYIPLKFQTHDQNYAAYLQGRCVALTSSLALLASRRSTFADPAAHRLLSEPISKEPNAPATSQGDPAWADALRWTVYALFQAEELGITKANVAARLAEAKANPNQADLRRFLGVEGEFGRQLGLPADFVVKAVGAVGSGSRLRLERGVNRPWTRGGLLYAPPFR
jgi:general L-amino acid transport system substrate-binding protein